MFSRQDPNRRREAARKQALLNENKRREQQRAVTSAVLKEYKRLHRAVLRHIDGDTAQYERAHADLVEFEQTWGLREKGE